MTPVAIQERPPPDWMAAALTSIGMATISTDADERILSMNSVAEKLIGWSLKNAVGQLLGDVFRIETELTRTPASSGLKSVLSTGQPIGLTDHTILIHRDGTEHRIDHGAAAIRNSVHEIVGAVFFFCDVSERQRLAQKVEDSRALAAKIIESIRIPLVTLDASLQLAEEKRESSNSIQSTKSETTGCLLFANECRSWDNLELRKRLNEIVPQAQQLDDLDLSKDASSQDARSLSLNTDRLCSSKRLTQLILSAIEDHSSKKQDSVQLRLSETRYRRLFETAQDGILLVDPVTRLIFDANPFLLQMLGYPHSEVIGRELWEIGFFSDIHANKEAFRTLQDVGYIRYEDLPLETRDKKKIEVEFVSNVYTVGDARVIQCNIRNITDRKRVEEALAVAHAGLESRVVERTAELAAANISLNREILRREGAEADRRDLQQQLVTVQEQERLRISRELHDAMGQHLTALGLGLQLIKNSTAATSPKAEQLQKLLALTDQIGRDVHHLAMELRPTALDDLGLVVALATYAETWSERSGMEIDLQQDGLDEERLPSMIETALYRVVQESLTNVMRHAKATRVSIILQRTPEMVSAVIEDNGRGFEAESLSSFRLGILGMRERMSLIGGTLIVESEPDQGTAVYARIPLQTNSIGEAS